jgi:hypothetical protein
VGSRRLVALACLCLALGAGGCLGGDDETTSPGERYAVRVERISDDVDRDGERALAALNRFAEGRAEATEVAALLDRLARDAAASQNELDRLSPPAAAESSDDDLVVAARDIALYREIAATDVRATERGISTAREVGRSQARLLLAYQVGFSALSRAVRALAIEVD